MSRRLPMTAFDDDLSTLYATKLPARVAGGFPPFRPFRLEKFNAPEQRAPP